MLVNIKTGEPPPQRSAVPPPLPYNDKLVARAQYKFLKDMGATTLGWAGLTVTVLDGRRGWTPTWNTAPFRWKAVRDFPGVWRCLKYKTDDGEDWHECPINKFTEHWKLCRVLELPYEIGSWRDVLKRYGVWKLASYVTAPVEKGKRSDVIYKLIMTLTERGASAEENYVVLEASKCAQSKYWNHPHRLVREIERVMAKAR